MPVYLLLSLLFLTDDTGDNLICVLSQPSQQGGVSWNGSMAFVSAEAGPHCTDGLGLVEPAPGVGLVLTNDLPVTRF